MPPKKGKKISLNEFLGDSSLGSWADEMDALPNAPAVRAEGDDGRDRFNRRDDYLSTRPDRPSGPPREDLPLPTQPPYTAFIGNLAFDLIDSEMEEYFGPKVKSVKIIKDREDKPKGFGYIEFEDLDGLKEALEKSGSNFSGRTIRVSVAEPPKERGGFGAAGSDEAKFDDPWRRGGPLPDLQGSRDSSRRRFDGPRSDDRAGVSEGPSDWRAGGRPSRPFEPEGPSPPGSIRRKGPGFTQDGGAADAAETWTIGSKFKPAPAEDERNGKDSKFGSLRGRSDMGPPRDPIPEENSDWRSAPRARPGRDGHSPNNSTPPTPQLSRRKLELLPRSGSVSGTSSPLQSPKLGPTPTSSSSNNARSNPFGAAKPVDVTSREKEVAERLEKDRELQKERLTMSRTSSRTGTDRPIMRRMDTPPTTSVPPTPSSPKHAFSAATSPKAPVSNPSVRANVSFASAAAKRETLQSDIKVVNQVLKASEEKDGSVDEVTETVAQVTV